MTKTKQQSTKHKVPQKIKIEIRYLKIRKKKPRFFWADFQFSLLKLLKEIKRFFCFIKRINIIEMRNTLPKSFDVFAYIFLPLCYKLYLLCFPKLAESSQAK